ncbi:hypothetical protein LNO78_28700 [Klebsiella pneumoniae subsp. pneumoniae]|nr:hypothetical protein [Klebsiella pneumoniae subsp. pneumoniae]
MLKAFIEHLEESNAQVIQSRDHYKRMAEEALKCAAGCQWKWFLRRVESE